MDEAEGDFAMMVSRTPNGLSVEVENEAETARLGRAIAEEIAVGTVIGLVGPLGAGKTRLARAIAEALGVGPDAISSPTFVLVQEHEGRLPIFHCDVYRLPSPEAFEELGVSELWDKGVALVEWADRAAGVLPERSWTVRISPDGPGGRRVIEIELPGPSQAIADRLVRALTSRQDFG